MKYTVCFLFNEDMSLVLLQQKLRSSYAGKYNGVGGKYDNRLDRSYKDCCIREVKEETTADVRGRLVWLGTLTCPLDCASDDRIADVAFFAAKVKPEEVVKVEDEKLEWFATSDIVSRFVQDPMLAGDGNLQYFVNMALILMEDRK